MKIFLLKNLRSVGAGETRAMIVSASTEEYARSFAMAVRHSHNNEASNGYGDEGFMVWRDNNLSSCEEIGMAHPTQPLGVLLTDFVYD